MGTPSIRNRFSGRGDRIGDSAVNKWINVFGDVQVIQNLERLKTSMTRKVLKKAIGKGVKEIAKVAREKVPEDSGLLKKSIKSAVTKMVSGKVYVDPKVFAAKGEATGGELKIIKIKNAKGYKAKEAQSSAIAKIGGDAKIKKPAKYAHLVEFGTKNAKAQPFMRPAIDESRSRVLSIIENEAKAELRKMGAG